MIELGQEVYPLFFALYECGVLRSTEWCHGAGEESPGSGGEPWEWRALGWNPTFSISWICYLKINRLSFKLLILSYNCHK